MGGPRANRGSRLSKIGAFRILFAVGFVAHFLGAFSPIHELGHVVFGGPGSCILDWSHARVTELTFAACIGGVLFDWMVGLALSSVVYFLARTKHTFHAAIGFAWGLANSATVGGPLLLGFELMPLFSTGEIGWLWFLVVGTVACFGWWMIIQQYGATTPRVRKARLKPLPLTEPLACESRLQLRKDLRRIVGLKWNIQCNLNLTPLSPSIRWPVSVLEQSARASSWMQDDPAMRQLLRVPSW